MGEIFGKTMTSPHVPKQAGTPVGPSVRSIWAWWYIGANFDASFTIMSGSAISTYVLHTTDYSTTADYYRVYGLAQRMLYSYPFLPDSFRFPLPSSWCMCTSCNHFTCLLKVNENILYSSDTCFDQDIFLPQVRFGIRNNEG